MHQGMWMYKESGGKVSMVVIEKVLFSSLVRLALFLDG